MMICILICLYTLNFNKKIFLASPIKKDENPTRKPRAKLFICDEKNDDCLPKLEAVEGTEIRFSKIPEKSYPENSTPSEITKHSLDSSYLLNQIRSQHDK